MERLRRAALVGAVAFPGLHLLLWVATLPALFGKAPPGEPESGRWVAVGLFLLVGALGALAVVLPVRALAAPSRRRGWAVIGLGGLYAGLAGLAFFGTWEGAEGWRGSVAEVALFVVYLPLLVASLFTGGLLQALAVPAGLYAAALLLGGALTVRAASREGGVVDATRDRR